MLLFVLGSFTTSWVGSGSLGFGGVSVTPAAFAAALYTLAGLAADLNLGRGIAALEPKRGTCAALGDVIPPLW